MNKKDRIQEAQDFIAEHSTKWGGQAQLAEDLSVTPQQLSNWKKRGVPHYFKILHTDLFKKRKT